jgi:hypothetical protein
LTWRTATFLVWGLLGLAALALAVVAATRRGRPLRGPFVAMRAYLAAHKAARVVAVLAWAWAGWHFFAR